MAFEMYESTDFEIDGVKFHLCALDGVAARPLWIGLVKVLGGSLGAAAGISGEGALLAALAASIQNIDEALYARMFAAFAKNATAETGPNQNPTVDQAQKTLFSRRPKLELMFVVECVKFQFADFLDANLLARLAALAAGKGSSPNPSPTS